MKEAVRKLALQNASSSWIYTHESGECDWANLPHISTLQRVVPLNLSPRFLHSELHSFKFNGGEGQYPLAKRAL